MRISVPENGGYYYDPGQKEDPVLLCWMPKQMLEEKVNIEGVSNEILLDYPHGLDLEVSEEQFRRFEDKYGLKMPFKASEILVSFEAFQRSKKVKTRGFIKAEALESTIKRTRLEEDAHQLLRKIESEAPPEVMRRFIDDKRAFEPNAARIQMEYRRSPAIQKRFDASLDGIRDLIEIHTPDKVPPEERAFGMPEMTKGESPVEFFFRFGRRTKGGK